MQQGPGNNLSRLGKVANAALGLSKAGELSLTLEQEARACELAQHDFDRSDGIATSWLERVRLLAAL